MGRQGTMLALIFMLTAFYGGSAFNERRDGLDLRRPEEVFRSEGGRVEVWSPDFRALQDARVAVDRVTLERRGLALSKYSEAAHLAYVLEGKAKIGLSYPWEQSAHIRTVQQGDVVAVPRGIGHWCYNDGDQRFVMIRVSDTLRVSEPSEFEEFYLHGGAAKERASILHGFDENLLSQAWDVDRDVVRQVTNSQKGTVIVKVKEGLDILRDSESDRESEEFWAKFSLNIDKEEPDVRVKNGGTFTLLSEKSLPILKEIKLSAIRVKLDREAMMAPSYACNMDGLLYVTRGSGRIQIIGSDQRILDTEVREGSLVLIPQFHPNIVKAGNEGLEFTSIANSERPNLSFLAGKNAVYRNIPIDVLAAGNNVPIEVEQKIRDRRQNDMMIFPPRGKEAITKLSDLFSSQFEDLKSVWDLKLRSQV